MASIQAFRQAITVQALLAVHGPSARMLTQSEGYQSSFGLPNMERGVSVFDTGKLLYRLGDDVFRTFDDDASNPVGKRFGIQPGQTIVQPIVYTVFSDIGSDSNTRSTICNVNIKVHRALQGDDDETLYVHEEMLISMEQLVRLDTWTGLSSEFGEFMVTPETEGEPVKQNNIISYAVAFQARVAVT